MASHPTYFGDFLRSEVNINDQRLTELKNRVDAVYAALRKDSVVGPLIRDKIPQGSWPHRTIIKPRPDGEFDADFLLIADRNDDWVEVKTYIDEVYKALGRNHTYTDMPHGRRCHCVWLEYAPQNGIGCHLDIVPCTIDEFGRFWIVNRDDNDWELTDPQGFTTWFAERDDITDGNFRRVVRLLKYVKRERGSFDGVASVLLTTIAGMQVTYVKTLADPSYYGDTPTAFVHVLEDVDRWLQGRPNKPSVPDPSGVGTFDHRWEQATYSNFRDRIHTIAEQARDAYNEPDPEKSVDKWQKVLGDRFTPALPSASKARTSPFLPTGAAVSSSLSGRAG